MRKTSYVIDLAAYVVEAELTTDGTLERIKNLSRIRFLVLTDAAVPRVEELRQLEGLAFSGTKISDEGVEKIRRALPRCRIDNRQAK